MSAIIFVVSLPMWRLRLFGQQGPAAGAPYWRSCATEEMKSAITDVSYAAVQPVLARTLAKRGGHLETFGGPSVSPGDRLLRLAAPSLLPSFPPASIILSGARSVSVATGQDSVYVQCTIFPVLNLAIAVFPKSTLQQKRAVPVLSLICLGSPRFPAARLRTSLATRRLFLSNTRHCTVPLHLHLLHNVSKSHAWASIGKHAYASVQLST
jgi:hypothetical protein